MQTILEVVFWLVSLTVSDDEIEKLRASAPTYLDTASATEHLIAADTAARRYRLDRSLILSIAWHESRFDHTATTPELGGKVSCGVMTAEPTHSSTACARATSSLLAGYLTGAAHLRGWFDATRSRREALLGYAGGNRLIAACRQGPVLRRGVGDDLCLTPAVFEERARRVRGKPAVQWRLRLTKTGI